MVDDLQSKMVIRHTFTKPAQSHFVDLQSNSSSPKGRREPHTTQHNGRSEILHCARVVHSPRKQNCKPPEDLRPTSLPQRGCKWRHEHNSLKTEGIHKYRIETIRDNKKGKIENTRACTDNEDDDNRRVIKYKIKHEHRVKQNPTRAQNTKYDV